MFDPNPQFIQNFDGTRSTHRMAAEVDKEGNWWAFPTIVPHNGNLIQLDNRLAMQWNQLSGEAVPFGKNKPMALNFAQGGYKLGTPLESKNIYP